jgi:membrane-bound transcription factor site-1 protease
MFEQGSGRLNLSASAIFLDEYEPMVTVLPSRLNTSDCPYTWPYCEQPLFHTAMPLLVNFTLINGTLSLCT